MAGSRAAGLITRSPTRNGKSGLAKAAAPPVPAALPDAAAMEDPMPADLALSRRFFAGPSLLTFGDRFFLAIRESRTTTSVVCLLSCCNHVAWSFWECLKMAGNKREQMRHAAT